MAEDPHPVPAAGPAGAVEPVAGAIETDAVIVGAGPAGLFQVFELGLLEIQAHVIDSLPQAGGQCVELYADKPIFDIPAVPVCTGQELTDRLLQQAAPFGACFHFGEEVSTVRPLPDGRFFVATRQGTRLLSRTVFIAGGVGSFQPRLLNVSGLERFNDTQVFYRVRDPAQFAGQHLVIVGGGDAALDWALHFAQPGPHRAASVVLVHRRDDFRAAPAQVAKMRALCAAQQMQFVAAQVTGFEEAAGRLQQLKLTAGDGVTRTLPLDSLLVFFGLSPRLGPIAEWGLGIDRKQIVVDTAKFETSVPGIFAVGDINTYPGKKKLILSAFHEATLAAYGAAPYVFPDRRTVLEYTTSSTRLHRVLGVASPAADD